MESEFEVVDDLVYDFMIFDKSNDFHFCTTLRTEEGGRVHRACGLSWPRLWRVDDGLLPQ